MTNVRFLPTPASHPARAREEMSRIARRLRDKRIASGLTASDLAGLTGLSSDYIDAVESARASPSLMTICLLASALGTDLAALSRS